MTLAELKKQAIEDNLIDPDYHDQLLADIAAVVRQAGIPERYVWQSAREYCSPEELAYVASIKEDDSKIGMVYVGSFNKGKSVNERMMSIAGACLRNYINAKVMTLYDVLQCLKDGDMPSPTVLLIPDFYNGGTLAEWQKSGLMGMLLKREQQDKKTIVYVSNPDAMELEYGEQFTKHLADHFIGIEED